MQLGLLALELFDQAGQPCEVLFLTVAELARAGLSLWASDVIPPTDHGRAKFTLARALWESNTDRQRALELAKEGRAELAKTIRRDRRAEVDAWLAARR